MEHVMRLSLWVLLAITLALSGCTRHVFSPPTRLVPVETASTLEASETSAGLHAGPRGALFGPSLVVVAGQGRHGVTEDLELGADLNYMYVSDESEGIAVDYSRHAFSGRASLKWAPEVLGQYVALVGGVGGGHSAAGSFVSPDVGVLLSYDWYVTPIVSAGVFVSQPIGAKTLDLRETPDDDPLLSTPEFTYGYSLATGLAIPIKRVKFTLGLSLDVVNDSERQLPFLGLTAGWSYRF